MHVHTFLQFAHITRFPLASLGRPLPISIHVDAVVGGRPGRAEVSVLDFCSIHPHKVSSLEEMSEKYIWSLFTYKYNVCYSHIPYTHHTPHTHTPHTQHNHHRSYITYHIYHRHIILHTYTTYIIYHTQRIHHTHTWATEAGGGTPHNLDGGIAPAPNNILSWMNENNACFPGHCWNHVSPPPPIVICFRRRCTHTTHHIHNKSLHQPYHHI